MIRLLVANVVVALACRFSKPIFRFLSATCLHHRITNSCLICPWTSTIYISPTVFDTGSPFTQPYRYTLWSTSPFRVPWFVAGLGLGHFRNDPARDAAPEADRSETQVFVLPRAYSDVCWHFSLMSSIVRWLSLFFPYCSALGSLTYWWANSLKNPIPNRRSSRPFSRCVFLVIIL